ncbi:cytochrome bc1 complex cytochrome b subunit [Enemella evansiae]|uniref:cytochrome bc1 complex cytochrome b subunit n=1 Tax=Enemella evansiae TaxID=2016499 RepID=UPI0010615C9D|nr:ubiquinol-cytochrome c reductase cytochrome b subunit [Enemella evansiae]TDO93833.1 menaquinol-cytochrome c reductase cytochrome b subunit precursor [Enemella evansiae]
MAKPAQVSETPTDVTTAQSPDKKHPLQPLAGPAKWADDRLGLAALGKKNLRKVFPDHWSFLLGEIALYSFVILLITGVFLTIWFKPSMAEVEYEGSYQLLKGVEMSEAFASTLTLSFDIRGGLLIRQMHHWAAMLFIGAMFVHSLRVFFTGAFRKPRELNWLLGVGLLSMGMVEGFAGYSLPDDLLSGTGLRFADGMIRSIPIIGSWAEFFVFGGEYPGSLIVPRLYMVHILLLPGLILGLIAAHLALVVYHKHTQYPGPGRKESNVVGYPLFPVYMAKAGGFFFIVSGVLVLMGAFFQINPVWSYGPYNPAEVTAGSQPDWYMGPAEGAVRIMPNWEWNFPNASVFSTWSWNVFIPGVGMLGLLFTSMAIYPFIERWITKDEREHHVLEYPYQNPNRTAFGVAAITCYLVFLFGGGNDILAVKFNLSLNAVTYFLRVAVFLGPVIAFIVTKRICLGIQRQKRERILHGSESGQMERAADGGYSEGHVPISTDEAYTLTYRSDVLPIEPGETTDDAGVRVKGGASKARARMHRWFFRDNIRKPSREEYQEAVEHTLHESNGDGSHEVESSDPKELDRSGQQ